MIPILGGGKKRYIRVALSEKIVERKAPTLERKNYREKDVSIEQIDQMSGIEFEYFLKRFFENSGNKVTITSMSGDQGDDLILHCESHKVAIQAKRYNISNKVGNSAVQEVSTGKIFYDCDEAYIITTSYFTNQTVILATKVKVKLMDRNKLKLLLKGKIQI